MLRPIDADVHLKYICDECGSTMWASITEARTPNFILICGECNSVHKLKLVDKFTVSFVKAETKTEAIYSRVKQDNIKKIKNELKEENKIVQDVISMLVNLGHDKKKAKVLVGQGISINKGLNEDELIKWCLSHSSG